MKFNEHETAGLIDRKPPDQPSRSSNLVAAMSIKACVIADAAGRAIGFRLAPGQAHELPLAPALVASLPDEAGWIVADKGCASHASRELIWNSGTRPAIPFKSNEAAVACPSWIYTNCNRMEWLWARLKE